MTDLAFKIPMRTSTSDPVLHDRVVAGFRGADNLSGRTPPSFVMVAGQIATRG